MATEKKIWKDVHSSSAKERKTPEIGQFEEAAGGGTPMTRGQKIDHVAETPKEADEYRAEHPGAIVRVKQPRDTDGQFTYNSANKRELEYGPSRGKTTPPFLTGFKVTFAKKSGKGAVVTPDNKMFKMPDSIKSKDDFERAYMEYRKEGDKFMGLSKEGKEIEAGSLSDRAIGRGGKAGRDTKEVTRGYLESAKKMKMKKNFRKVEKSGGGGEAPKAPTTPTPTPKTESTQPKGGSVDYSLAKSDPDRFVEENMDEIDKLIQEADAAGYELDADAMIDAIASGEYKDFDAIRATLK
jgi:hypothetical protein